MSKHERIKQDKEPLDAREDVFRGARDGREALTDDDLFRLKWHGLYEHNAKDGHFMLRVKVVQGILSAPQAETLAWIAEHHGRGMIDCTTRQCVQIHWITLDAMPEIYRRLELVGLTDDRRLRRRHPQRHRLHRRRHRPRRDRRRLRDGAGAARALPRQP